VGETHWAVVSGCRRYRLSGVLPVPVPAPGINGLGLHGAFCPVLGGTMLASRSFKLAFFFVTTSNCGTAKDGGADVAACCVAKCSLTAGTSRVSPLWD
jgi:hypothetical protein